jgi:uncharacterized membrane protein
MLSTDYLKSVFKLSIVGAFLGTLFLSVSLAPSLLPRPPAVQGILAGMSFAVGYGLGVAGLALWRFLQLPEPGPRLARLLTLAATALCTLIAISFLWRASSWQNSLREMMGMGESMGLQPLSVGAVALLVFAVLLTLARLFRRVFHFLSRQLDRFVPPRVSHMVGIALSVLLFWSAIDGVLFGYLLRAADQSFQQLDAFIEPDLPPPARPEQTGSAESLLAWQQLGRQGRRFIAGGPDAQTLENFFATPTPAPLRIYVGLNSADTSEERARLALDELKRVGAFERAVLLLVTPTGTGWVDPASQDPVEYLLRGDVATVAVQYSYLNSPLALLTQAAYGAEVARTVFVEIYRYWRALPASQRPKLYLNGLSLGSLNSDLSFDLFDIIDAPFAGALWSGPPFRNESWQRMTRDREPGSPAWLPRFRNGSVVRFMNQHISPVDGYGTWDDFRIVFLQYASDPITFFDPSIAWREPDWMKQPRGPDVSPDLRWFPVVTMLQLAADMVVGTAPPGFGHEYAMEDYIQAWLALAEPGGWTPAELARLRHHLDQRPSP